MTSPCLFCRQPVVAGDVGITEWYGDGLCHAACSDWLTQAACDFKPVEVESHPKYDPDHVPKVYGWAGASFSDYDAEWPEMEESLKEKLYDKYLEYLNKLLSHQEGIIKAYCQRHGLGEPKIIKELKQASQHMIEMYRAMESEDMKPGDHFVIAMLPRTQRHNRWVSATLVKNIAVKFADMGVTFHSAMVGLDWSKPVAQHAVRMAYNIQKWQQSIFTDAMDYEHGRIRRMFGYSWGQIQHHQLFQWVIRHVRDKKMSPAECWSASQNYWAVNVFIPNNRRWWTLMITKDKFLAFDKRKQAHYYCSKHKQTSLLQRCKACGELCQYVKVYIERGLYLNPRRKRFESEETYMRLWAFYCEKNPDQEKQPWLSRSRFPEIMPLRDLNFEKAEDGYDKT